MESDQPYETTPYIRIKCLRSAPPLFGVPGMGHCIKGPLWKTDENHRFLFKMRMELFDVTLEMPMTIEKGFVFDKASIPPCMWGWPLNLLPDGKVTMPALEHDYLCRMLGSKVGMIQEEVTPSMAHLHFRRRLIEYGESKWRAGVYYWVVRLFGPGGILKPSTIVRGMLRIKNQHKHEATDEPT